MSKLTLLREHCTKCGKVAKETKRATVKNKTLIFLACGHIHAEEISTTPVSALDSLQSMKWGYFLYDYQKKSVRFLEQANHKALIAHEMGLGKTVIAVVALTLHPELLPALVLCPSAVKYNWLIEIVDWSRGKLFPQLVENKNSKPEPMFPIHIASHDILSRVEKSENNWLNDYSPKTVIIDECQRIKNPSSQRTQVIRSIAKKAEHVIALSGTPIKNNALEYFTVLNILQPEKFYSQEQMMREYVDYYYNGYTYKVGGLQDRDRFNEDTKHFILRYTREEVMPDLPKISRQFRFCNLGEDVQDAYNRELKEFSEFYDEGNTSFNAYGQSLAYLNKMRHLTGIAKIKPTIEFVLDFLDSTDRKITLFVHHKDVGQTLFDELSEYCKSIEIPAPLMLTSSLNAEERQRVVNKFTNEPNRILIASQLASGEGINLQVCSDCVMVERQWNPANEEQAEARFPRIGSKASVVFATYMTCTNSIDEYFSELVERKRGIMKQTLDNEDYKWDETSVMKELMEIVALKGRKLWHLAGKS